MKTDKCRTIFLWLILNSIITMCIGFCLSSICLIPSCSPYLRSMFFDTNIDIVVPYIIGAMIAFPLISILCYWKWYFGRKP
jgi:O-antigen/teichoic acid export membrane protein